jgi:hypothetical protein
MAVIFEIKDRRVIPNWRDFKRTLPLQELQNNQSKSKLNIDISRAVQDWNLSKSVGIAADLINSAYISGKVNIPEVTEAINFILKENNGTSNALLKLVNNLSNVDQVDNTSDFDLNLHTNEITNNEFKSYTDNNILFKIIQENKFRTKSELRNPIPWVELSRLYSFFGQEANAEKAMLTALNLAPNNRFVLRSATRLFVHFEQYEKALYYLRKTDASKTDPWLASAHIATSSIIKRYSPLIKNGISIIQSKNFSNYELTELASSLGTLELSEGSYKKSRVYLELSSKSPNDNTLAQLEWISKEDSRFVFNPMRYKNVANPFEAFAFENYELGNYKEAYQDSIKWFLDMPYSKRPVLLGSYISSVFLKDVNATITFCKAGLRANPNDHTLLNNLVYTLLNDNKLDEALLYIPQLKRSFNDNMSDESRITLQATFGLIAFKYGNNEVGKHLYEIAIQNAETRKNNSLRDLAILNYTKILIEKDLPEKEFFVKKVYDFKLSEKQSDLKVQQAEVISLYEKLKSNENNRTS